MTLREIAELVGGEVVGDDGAVISGVAGIKEAKRGEITFVASQRYAALLDGTKASAAVVSMNGREGDYPIPVVVVKDPDVAFVKVVERFAPAPIRQPEGIDPTARVAPGVKVGKGVSIRAYCVVEEGAEIGDGTVLYPAVCVGHYAKIGRGCVLYPGVRVRERCVLGERVIIHSGAVIGSDGFGYSTIRGVHYKIPQVGIVEIEDDVEIGANCTVDRARFGKTLIKRGVKIDNLVQVAHNVTIGENCVIAAQTGIAGSTVLGRNVMIGGQVGVAGHLTIGDNVKIAGKSGVTKDIPDEACVSGFPAQQRTKELKMQAALRKLPEVLQMIRRLQARFNGGERKAKDDS